jgi:hypothetical protein
MLHASTQKLIVKLCELTEAGHIAWKHGDGQVRRFETEGYVVEVEGRPAMLRLLHSDGRELERADEADLAAQPWPEGNGTFASQITLMADRADRVARGAELAISRILSSLSAPPKSAAFEFSPGAPQPAAAATDRPPPPAPHTMPGPPPDPVASDTAIDRVLAVEPRAQRPIEPAAREPDPEPVIMESETAAVVGESETAGEGIGEAAATAPDAPVETAAPEPPDVAPVIIEAETVAMVAQPVETPPDPPASIPRPQQTFGAITSFARPRDFSATPNLARALSPKPFSTSPLFFGVNQMSREPARPEPEPPPVPPPTAKPIPPAPPAAERKPHPAITGPDIYKPWS